MDWKTDLDPLVRSVDLDVGQCAKVALSDGTEASVRLIDLAEERDDLRNAVRRAVVDVEVNGERAQIVSATYHLPVVVGGVQIDCPVTGGHVTKEGGNRWGLQSDARLRLWPAGSPWIRPGTFGYPVNQRWFATNTQMANEPCFVDGVERPGATRIYYHDGLDFGGAEGLVDVLATSDGLVISAGEEQIPGHDDAGKPKYDSVCIQDRRGWYERYVHLRSIDPAMVPGQVVRMGQRVGALGKEGSSGGWSHLHFSVRKRQPSGLWGTEEAYAFAWQAYREQYAPQLVAHARPHKLLWSGDSTVLDASLSWSADGAPLTCEWTFTDGTKATGQQIERTYEKPGVFSETLKVTDAAGRVDYDFAVVEVADREQPERLAAGIHPACFPTFGIKPGDPVTFKVRSFGMPTSPEVWDFGDGSDPVSVQSDGNAEVYAPDGYAETVHSFKRLGDYIVTVRRTNQHDFESTGRLFVRVDDA